MNFAFSEEQIELRKAIRRFLDAKSPEEEVRRLMETEAGYDTAVWTQMAQQMGLQGLVIPEEYGGSGFGCVELTVVLEEMGRALLCSPYFSTVVMAASLLLAADDEGAKQDLLPSIADGSAVVTVALGEASGGWDEDSVSLPAVKTDSGWTLTGEKLYVLDGHLADTVLTVARTPAGIGIFAVDKGAPGFAAVPLATLDETRKQARLTFEGTPARLVGDLNAGWAPVAKMLQMVAIQLAAEQVGGAQRVLEMAVDYAKTRVQYGRAIGSFQAIKHKCADLLVEIEAAKSAAYCASWAAADNSEDVPLFASMAKSYCSDAYFHACAENIQIHGGIGFTWEHPAHLYFKRAKSSELLFGDPTYHRELVAQQLGV